MNAKKLYFGFIGLLVLLGIGLLVGAYEANGILGHKSRQLADLKAKANSLGQQQLQLAQDKKDIAANKDLNDIAKSVVPQDKQPAEAVREIVNLAQRNGITHLSSITFPSSTLGGSSTPGAVSSTFANPNSKANQLTQLTPVKNIKGVSGVYTLQITVQQSQNDKVPYSNFIGFLKGLEQNRRTSQVSAISIQPDAKDPNSVSFTLTIDEYIKP